MRHHDRVGSWRARPAAEPALSAAAVRSWRLDPSSSSRVWQPHRGTAAHRLLSAEGVREAARRSTRVDRTEDDTSSRSVTGGGAGRKAHHFGRYPRCSVGPSSTRPGDEVLCWPSTWPTTAARMVELTRRLSLVMGAVTVGRCTGHRMVMVSQSIPEETHGRAADGLGSS